MSIQLHEYIIPIENILYILYKGENIIYVTLKNNKTKKFKYDESWNHVKSRVDDIHSKINNYYNK